MKYFRGGFAPASLKPDLHFWPWSVVLLFPGRIRPGLIEAVPRRRQPTRAPAYFRGGFAPASLKRLVHRSLPGGPTIFPGRIRPGLIEATTSRPQRRTFRSFPGRIRPGLIEAATSSRKTGQPRNGISGADSPRPH